MECEFIVVPSVKRCGAWKVLFILLCCEETRYLTPVSKM